MGLKRKNFKTVILIIFLTIIILIFLYPLLIVFINSIKPLGEIVSNPLGFPSNLQLGNFSKAWKTIEIPKLLRNTTLITAAGILGILLLSSMAAYWCERYPTMYSRLFSKLLMASMLIPFATIMIPLVQVTRVLHLNNSLYGIVIVYWGLGLAFAFFLLQGTVRGIPYELEEAAQIDGCGPIRSFWLVIFPLMKTGIISVAVMDIFWLWNDFMTPLILLNNGKYDTIQLGINKLFGMYSSKWDIALPALVITMLPILVVFVLLQKKIMSGVVAGAVKG
ncbi:carbohydrate ABC transporter permease [Diplocloster agilis]|uniref:carbohydrate ABC transporter permease n=1 Tax=Diplocloster agilis TaxID=2850323 RepID=UPI001EE977E8|nr:carbohydrate ABC transporter permease [Diplocloster agilis]